MKKIIAGLPKKPIKISFNPVYKNDVLDMVRVGVVLQHDDGESSLSCIVRYMKQEEMIKEAFSQAQDMLNDLIAENEAVDN